MKKIIKLLLISLFITACSNKEEKMYSNISVNSGFDTYISIQASSKSKEEFDEIFSESIEDFKYLNKLFDIYKNYDVNNLKTINDNAGISPVEVDPIIIDLIEKSKEFYEISNHEFDITIGPALNIWHKYREDSINLNNGENGDIPSDKELEETKKCIGFDNIVIDKEKNTVFLKNKCSSIDAGGIAKGYAAEYVAKKLENKKIKVGVVDAGGNNRTINSKLDKTPWRVGIQNPSGNGSILVVENYGSSSFVTSGDYQRFYKGKDGEIYHHIIDPKTFYPARYYTSVSIITDDSTSADALSTSLFTSDFKTGNSILENYRKQNPDKEVEAIWISKNLENLKTNNYIQADGYYIAYTEGLKDKIIRK